MTTTAIAVEDLADMRTEEECPLVNGQYAIVPDGSKTKKTELHQRVTNFIGPLKDMYLIQKSDLRKVALGLVSDPGLFALVAAAHPDDRRALDDYCRKAKTAAKGDQRSQLGTALHTMTERVDRGEDPDTFPEPFRSDLKAYRAALDAAGIQILHIERYVVLPDLKVAGRTDRIVQFGSKPMVADIKTGSLDFGVAEIAAQIGAYANGTTFYNPKTQTHEPMPDMDRDTGIIIHLPAAQARCELHFVDIKAGWEAAQHADWIRQWRRRKDLSEPWNPHSPTTQPDVRRARLIERALTLPRDQLAAAWPPDVPTFKQTATHTPGQLDLIAIAISTVENRNQAPFAIPDPADI